jgi:hypothetical protein
MSTQTDMAIQLYMQSSILLSNFYGFQTVQYSEIQERSARAGFSTLPFMPPETVRATPELVSFANNYENNPAMLDFIVKKYGYKTIVKYYIRTGLRAAQLICRNHLLNLEERNQYLDFLRKEFGVAYTLASGILEATHANRTLLNAVAISRSALDGAFDVYEEYRFLNIDREAARILVEAAQNKYAEYFMKQVDLASSDSTSVAGGYTFSDAINAVAIIEYQCTREGIRHLLTRSINNSPTNIEIDLESGMVMFKSANSATPATGEFSPRTIQTPAELPPVALPLSVPARPVVVVPVPSSRGPNIATVPPPSRNVTQKEGASRKPSAVDVEIALDVLLAYVNTGTPADKSNALQNLQGLLADAAVQNAIPPDRRTNPQIETFLVRGRPELDAARQQLVILARQKQFITAR